MHLALFWLLLLPVGHTLVLSEWRADRRKPGRGGSTRQYRASPSLPVLEPALIYLVAGLWKWTSPMWRDGTRSMQSSTADFSEPGLLGSAAFAVSQALKLFGTCIRTAIPLIFILRRGHRAKYALLAALLGFHVGTLVTLRIPFANLACCAY